MIFFSCRTLGRLGLMTLAIIFIFLGFIHQGPLVEAAVGDKVINLPTNTLGVPKERLSYTIGVGYLNKIDKNYDYVVRVWKDDPIDSAFETRTYAFTHDGKKLWEFNHRMTSAQFGFDPTTVVSLSVWDMDGDGNDEVMTQVKEGTKIKVVMLNGETGAILKKSTALTSPSRHIQATIAYLDAVNPYLVITYGPDSRTVAYDKNLTVYSGFSFNNANYKKYSSTTNIYTANIDDDDNDEIILGSLLLDHNGSVYLDGTSFDHLGKATIGNRSFVADMDLNNPGLEWHLSRDGSKDDPFRVEPHYWEGPYVIALGKKKSDPKTVLWHHNEPESVNQPEGWGRMHRGWVSDVDPSPGMETKATGYFYKGTEWNDIKNRPQDNNPETPDPPQQDDSWVDSYKERFFLYDAQGNKLMEGDDNAQENIDNPYTGYPVYWDDDPRPEYYQYRKGKLRDKFRGNIIEGNFTFAPTNGSGEPIFADVKGDWREEIIVASGYALHIYTNTGSTSYPNRRSPRTDHLYLVNMASLGSGLPKPISHNSNTWTDGAIANPPECSDSKDNDSDGKTDFGSAVTNDSGCLSVTDNSEEGEAPLCPNGQIDPGEQCDGSNLNGATCISLGYTGGSLSCASSCSFNTSQCTVPSADGLAFQESSGQVVMEAENADVNIPRAGHSWIKATTSVGFTGTGYMTTDVDNDSSDGVITNNAELSYRVNFTTTGTYYVWVRAGAPNVNGNSIHAGLDGQVFDTSDNITDSAFGSTFNWGKATKDGPPATITVNTPGVHMVNFWMREDGFRFDKIILTKSSSTFSETGPAESPRR